ncbi:MAG: nicotinate-nucleotide diphosphorylase (carboxylating) [Candidatus Magasanikbacteria bacterium CG10_big_fil_rev_8_21_14_0_10_40_10]|uniref:Probable nicotinate-nucleotide pyrophosphorylase [carboxylating] n=1 Tax=Candidatus Magasanikbacteria bacterium CG10_big_fil_rev_8_21_14_0_10_40_10 TaxID=1974648 RepID=A0A2M6W2Z1_9BACT|nr:MAG: nicotinate-nucleotide diphosphorylase (carboxylating) [Candidatus Magasanikbacteria bacterium CG10_big_fil_rev_8_21_14_0_10_40_10]
MNKKTLIKRYFNQAGRLTIKNRTYQRQVKFLLDFCLREDLNKIGDITSEILVDKSARGQANIIAKQAGIMAGLQEAGWLLKKYKVSYQARVKDGDKIKSGQVLLVARGNLRKILLLERTILNVTQRMSGIATTTNRLAKIAGAKTLLCPTRKTQWGLLDKRAVVLGGGGTHRLGLYDFVLIKENHLADGRPLKNVIKKLSRQFWEIEAENPKQALALSALNPSALMFDDFTPAQITATIKKIRPVYKNIIFEASGGINESNISRYAKTGVDIISLGALTHSTQALDISLKID